VGCAFSILSNKLRIVQRPFIVSPEFAVVIIKASDVLHSFVLERDGVILKTLLHGIVLKMHLKDNQYLGG